MQILRDLIESFLEHTLNFSGSNSESQNFSDLFGDKMEISVQILVLAGFPPWRFMGAGSTADGHEHPVAIGSGPPARRGRHRTPPASTRPAVIPRSIIDGQESTKLVQQKKNPPVQKFPLFVRFVTRGTCLVSAYAELTIYKNFACGAQSR